MTRTGWGIKPLTRTRIPKVNIVLAAVSRLDGTVKAGYRETWRGAAVAYAKSDPDKARNAIYFDGTPERLWTEISRATRHKGVTQLWTYDLTRVARLTDMLRHMSAQGWTLTAFSLNPGAPWMVWKRGSRTLRMSDVASLWPDGLARVATLFGSSRKICDVGEEIQWIWSAQAAQDRNILRDAVFTYLEWIESEGLGNLAVTGNGQAWAAFRRRFLTHGVLVHDDDELHAMERAAMWTGRCEAYWHGTLGVVNVSEWDFSKAHTRIAAEVDLPTFPHAPIPPDCDLRDYLADERYAVLAEVDVNVTKPIVPTRRGEHIVWPVGEFTTTLWEPELRLLAEAGAIVRVRGGWLYRTAPVLRAWAEWILGQVDEPDGGTPAWRKELLSRWGNVLVGRFAMRYPRWEEIGRAPADDVFCMPSHNVDTGEDTLLMQIGRTLWLQQGTDAPHDSAPAITGYVMSEMRARLWRLMSMLPSRTLLYVDTDSLLVAERDNPRMEALAQSGWGVGLRLKRSWDGMAIYGPRQLETGDAVRIAGLPKTARRTGRNEWEGEITESLQQALAGRSPDAVRSTERQWEMGGVDVRRQGDGIGWTRPYVMR